MTTIQKKEKSFSVAPTEKTELIPSENLAVFESDRFTAHFWVSRKVADAFQDACHLSGRKTCDVIEPFMEAYVKIVKNKVLSKVDMCPFKAVEIHIGTLQILQKYAKRGRKENEGLVFCKESGKENSRDYCLHFCKFGGNYEKHVETPCKTFLALE